MNTSMYARQQLAALRSPGERCLGGSESDQIQAETVGFLQGL